MRFPIFFQSLALPQEGTWVWRGGSALTALEAVVLPTSLQLELGLGCASAGFSERGGLVLPLESSGTVRPSPQYGHGHSLPLKEHGHLLLPIHPRPQALLTLWPLVTITVQPLPNPWSSSSPGLPHLHHPCLVSLLEQTPQAGSRSHSIPLVVTNAWLGPSHAT